jgi:hypothetical protein
MKQWCKNIRDLWDKTHQTGHGELAGEYGWCQCDVREAILHAPPDQQAQLVSGIFWSAWIDQVLFSLGEREVYQKFRETYLFPKIYSHAGGGHAAPHVLLGIEAKEGNYQALLHEDKKEFWGEVANYLESIGKHDIVERAEREFINDLTERNFPIELHGLWIA